MINLTVVIDNDEAIRKLRELQKVAKTTTSSVVKDSERMDASWQQMKNTLMSLTAGVSFAALAKQVVQIRGEVQQLEVAFETMLGSKQKADTLMSEIIDLAAKTPFGLQDVSNATKMLLAYGSTAEEVTGEIKMLGNIASGLSIPLNDLIYLYGTTRTQGRMFTMDLRQFMGRGIPLAEELAKQFGVTKDKVGELVTAGKVGFPEMQKALQAMTSEGGQFNNLMEKQSQTITGQISNLEDAIYQMFNEIGESSEGVISDIISGASWVVEHYQEMLNVLKYVIAAYGSYKAALIAVAAVEHVVTMAKMAKTLIDVARGAQTAAAAFTLLNSSKKGWIGIAAGVVGALAIATMDLSKSSEKAAREIGELEKAARDEHIEVNKLVFRLRDANTSEAERRKILESLRSINPKIVDGIDAESLSIEALTRNLERYNFEQTKTIQLKAINDRQNKAVEAQAQAELKLEEERLKLRKDVENIIAAYQTSGKLPAIDVDINAGFVTEERKERVQAQLRKHLENAIKRRISGEIDDEGFALALQKLADTEIYRTPDTGAMPLKEAIDYDIKGIEESNSLKRIKKYTEDLADANATLKNETQNSQYLLDAFGFLEEDNEAGNSGATAATYAQAFADAQKEYLSTQRELAKAIDDAKAGKGDTTIEAFKDIQARADAAKKAYEELGGMTSTKTQTDKEKRANEAAKLAMELQNKADQAEINAMEDGTMKKLAQIDHDYELRKQAIEKEQVELIAAQGKALTPEQQSLFDTLHSNNSRQRENDIEELLRKDLEYRDEYRIKYGDARERELAIKEKYDRLMADTDSPWQRRMLMKQRDQELAIDDNAMNEYLIQYGTIQEKILATTKKYQRLIADAQTEGERKTLERERDALLTEYKVAASDWAKELVDKSTNQLNNMLDELQTQVDAKQEAFEALDSSDSATAQEYLKEIETLKAKIKELQSLLGEADNAAKGENWGAASEVFQGIATACNEAADALEGVDSSLADTFRNMGQVASAAGSLVSAISAVAAASGALQTALGIIGLIAAAIQAVGVIISMFGDEYTLEDTINEAKELNKELERMRKLAQIDSVDGGLFGENAWGNFRNNLKVMGDALKSFHDTQDAIINRGKEVWGDVAESHGVFTEEMKEAGAGWDDARVTLEHSWASLEDSIRNIQIKTRDRSKAAEFFGARDEYANLGDLAPEIFEGGKVTLEGLQELKNSELWDKISQENKDLIDELIANWELYNDSLEATNEYLGSIFGELGNAIKDALVDAFESGTDAAEAMGDAIGNVIKQITSDIAYSAFIMPLIEDANNAIKALTLLKEQHGISDEEYAEKLITIGYNLVDGALAQQDAVNAFLGGAYDAAIERGYDPNSMGQSTTSKGFQAMSQDTGDELNGRFTDIQGKVSGIHEAVQFMKGLNSEQLNRVASIDTTVAMIHNDTTLIEKHTKQLYKISEGIDRMNRNIENGLV